MNVTNSFKEEFTKSGGEDTIDSVFILSYGEAKQYLKELELDRIDEAYWIRNPKGTNGLSAVICEGIVARNFGDMSSEDVKHKVGVRPAMWVTTGENVEVYTAKANKSSEASASAKSSNTSTSSTERVKCSLCNGTGSVRYYYGESALEAALTGHDDFTVGKCSSCDGTGYVDVKTSGAKTSEKNKVCPSCGKYVSKLITKKDAAGVSRTWCSSCWSSYNDIMGN